MDIDVLIRLTSGGENTSAPRWAGDLVGYKPRPHKGWGRAEGLPTFGILTVTDTSKRAVNDRCKRHHVEYEPDMKTEKFRVRTSHWINLNLLTAQQKEELTKTGALTMSATEFYSRCNNRIASLR